MPRKTKTQEAPPPKANGAFTYAFPMVADDEARDRILTFLERLNDLTDGDIASETGKTAIVRTDNKAMIQMLNLLRGAKKKMGRDGLGLSWVEFPMLHVKDLAALEELVGAAGELLNLEEGPVVKIEQGEVVVCNTHRKDLAGILAGYAEKISNGHAIELGIE